MSRKTIRPDAESLKKLKLGTIFADKVRTILAECGAPKHWGNAEVTLLLRWFLFPSLFNPLKKTEVGWAVPDSERVYAALLFAKMFSEGRHALIRVLPKIQRHLQSRFRSPQAMMEISIALHNEITAGPNREPSWYFWDQSAKALACAATEGLKLPVTPKKVYKARESLRQRISPASELIRGIGLVA